MKIEYFQTIRKRDFEENKKKKSDCLAYNHSVSFINKPWTFISAIKLKKDFTKVSRVGLLFDFNLQYRSIYATFKLLAQFSFGSTLKME